MFIKDNNQGDWNGVNISRWCSAWLVESVAGAFKVPFKPDNAMHGEVSKL